MRTFPPSLRIVPLSRYEWFCGLFALIAGTAFIIRNLLYYPIIYDALDYWLLAKNINTDGLLSFNSPLRIYGYPFWLSLFLPAADWLNINFRCLVLPQQLMLYLLSALWLRQSISAYSLRAARLVWMGLCCNIYALAWLSEILTDGFSLILFVMNAAWWVGLSLRLKSASLRHILCWCFLGGVLCGFTIVSRPSNLAISTAWLLAMATLFITLRNDKKQAGTKLFIFIIAANLLGNALPIVPQVLINARAHNEVSFLHADHMNHWNSKLLTGLKFLKCTGQILFYQEPAGYRDAYYDNPLISDKVREKTLETFDATHWYFNHPLVGLSTIALHIFCILDQDLFFGHTPTLHPWWRIPQSIINHLMLAFSAIGLHAWWKHARRDITSPPFIALLILLTFIVTYTAIYSLVMSEMRYGLPILLAAAPLAAIGLDVFMQLTGRQRSVMLFSVEFYVLAAIMLSTWLQDQAPLIRGTVL